MASQHPRRTGRQRTAPRLGLRLRCLAAALCLEALAVGSGLLLATSAAAPLPRLRLAMLVETAASELPAEVPEPEATIAEPEPLVTAWEPTELPAEPLPDAPAPAPLPAAEPLPDPCVHPPAWLSSLVRQARTPVEPPRPESRPAPPSDATAAIPEPLPGCNLPPPYPAAAVRLGLEGRVGLELRLDPNGAVTQARVVATSGHPLLDLVARKALGRWRFTAGPATLPWVVEFRLAARDVMVFGAASER